MDVVKKIVEEIVSVQPMPDIDFTKLAIPLHVCIDRERRRIMGKKDEVDQEIKETLK